MIASFKHKGLRKFFEEDNPSAISGFGQGVVKKISRMLDVLDAASKPEDLNIPGYKFHQLNTVPVRYSIWVTGNWRITFAWAEESPVHVDYEDYH